MPERRGGLGGRIEELGIQDWEWVFSINIWGAVYMVQTFVPAMIERGRGRILITASGAGLVGIPGMAPYCASKFAMVGLAESLRCELIKHGITVSALCPGIINTGIIRDGRVYVRDDAGESAKSKVAEFYERFGTDPGKVAEDGMRALRRDTGSSRPQPTCGRFGL